MKRLGVVVMVACGSSSPTTPVGSRVGPAVTAALAAFDQARTPWRCASSDGPTLAAGTLAIGGRTWKLAGHTMSLDATGSIAIGIVSDAGGAAAPTIAALGRLHGKLAEADLVIALGGMGATQAELEATLGTLSEAARGPVIAVAGDLEPAPALAKAVAALRQRNHIVIDGRLAREIELPGASIATLPGAGAAVRLAAGADGCGYSSANLAAVLGNLTARPGIRILASAEAPRVVVDGEPTGELSITPGIDIVLHGPVSPDASRARAGTRDGGAVPLTPGTGDATTRLPGPKHTPSAGLLTISGSSWKWRPLTDD